MNALDHSRHPLDPAGLDIAALLTDAQQVRDPLVLVQAGTHSTAHLARCLDALRAHAPRAPVAVLTDPTGPAAAGLARRLQAGDLSVVEDLPQPQPGQDLLLLDAAVEVGPRWLGMLAAVLAGHPSAGSASAWCVRAASSAWPGHLPWTEIARGLAHAELPWAIDVPRAHHGCTLVAATLVAAAGQEATPAAGDSLSSRMDAALAASAHRHLLVPRVVARRTGPVPDLDPAAPFARSVAQVRQQLRRCSHVRPRRLLVTGHGVRSEIWSGLTHHQESYVLGVDDTGAFEVAPVSAHQPASIARWEPAHAVDQSTWWQQEYAQALAAVLLNLGIELVDVEDGPAVPLATTALVCRRLAIPLVLSTARGADRGADLDTAAQIAAAIAMPSQQAVDAFCAAHPRQAQRTQVVAPGTDAGLGFEPLRAAEQRRPGPPRILALAQRWTPAMGADLVRAVAAELGPTVEWHVAGEGAEQFAAFATVHARVPPQTLPAVVAEIDPDLLASLPRWPDPDPTVSAIAAATGVPLLTTDAAGSPDGPGGLRISASHEPAAAQRLATLLADATAIAGLRAQAGQRFVPSRLSAIERRHALYTRAGHGRSRARIGVVLHGGLGQHPATAHVRVLRRLANLDPLEGVIAHQVMAEDAAAGSGLDGLDALLVQRDALGPEVEPTIEAARRRGVRLVVDVDDDLLHADARDRMALSVEAHQQWRSGVRTLLSCADTIIASTPVIAERLAGVAPAPPVVVPNELDPRLWLRAVPADPAPDATEVRVLYMGTRTHLDDLMLLRHVIEQVRRDTRLPVVLEVVGVANSFEDDRWFRRLRVPPGIGNYPDFVTWLLSGRRRWAAAVAPLVDTAFNRAKSDLKLLEYALLEIPALASGVGPYRGGEAMAGLVENDERAWAAALSRCLTSQADAQTGARMARAHVLGERVLSPGRIDGWLRAVLG